MHSTSQGEESVSAGAYVTGEWSDCPNVDTACPGCLGRIRRLSGGVCACKCDDLLWRRHPLARPAERRWQVLFLDDVTGC